MIWVHVGFVKTATSTLQRAVFSKHEQINYFGLPASDPELRQLIHAIAKADSTEFDLDHARRTVAPHLRPLPPRQITLVSYENFVLYESTDKGVIAQRLRDIFPDCQILFTIRRQQDVLCSWYLQKLTKYLIGVNYLAFDEWFAIKSTEPHKSILNDLDFNSTISYYDTLFGQDKVKVFCFEQLVDDRAGYATAMADCLNVDAVAFARLLGSSNYNTTKTQRRIDFGRIATNYVPRAVVRHGVGVMPQRIKERYDEFLNRGARCQVTLSPAAERWITDHCRQGNRQLDARCGGQLARYGYTL